MEGPMSKCRIKYSVRHRAASLQATSGPYRHVTLGHKRYIVSQSLVPVLNDTKWDELRLAMYGLGPLRPRFRVKDIEDTHPGPWDGEWYYHFREGGYGSMEWVELQLADEGLRALVLQILASINLPGVRTNEGFIIFGHVPPGTPIEYIRADDELSDPKRGQVGG